MPLCILNKALYDWLEEQIILVHTLINWLFLSAAKTEKMHGTSATALTTRYATRLLDPCTMIYLKMIAGCHIFHVIACLKSFIKPLCLYQTGKFEVNTHGNSMFLLCGTRFWPAGILELMSCYCATGSILEL